MRLPPIPCPERHAQPTHRPAGVRTFTSSVLLLYFHVCRRVSAKHSSCELTRLKEADLVVSFLTRDQGKLRGVAKRARRPKSAFGAGLERLSHVRMAYFQRETRELVNLDSCELIRSQFGLVSDYWAGVALDYFAEVSEQLLPSAEPSEKFFRLLLAVLDSLRRRRNRRAGRVWRAVTYFSLWAVRLSGWLPELHVCLGCGSAAGRSRSTGARLFPPRPDGSDLRPLPRALRASAKLGIERRVPRHRRRDVAHAGGATSPRPTGPRTPPRTCGDSWSSRSNRTSNGGW